MTLEGAQRAMRNRGKNDVSRSAELVERLQNVRSMLLEMREMLGEDDAEVVVDDDMAVGTSETADAEEPHNDGVQVIEEGRLQRLEEERKAAENNARNAKLPFYEQTLF